ncbi:MAG: hypothetical protein OHK0012_13730 [Synechococcales cyanobacterium]
MPDTSLPVVQTAGLTINPRSALMRRFNDTFPTFYSQFASSEVQVQNLSLAYTLYQSRKAVVHFQDEPTRTVLTLAYRNEPSLLCDVFGVLTAFNLAIHHVNLYGQIYAPFLVFLRVVVSRNRAPLTGQTRQNLERALHEALAGIFDVQDMLTSEFHMDTSLAQAKVEFYVDPVFHLPAILIETDNQSSLLYKIMHAMWQEDVMVININMIVRKGGARFILYLLGASGGHIPEYLGHRLAASLRQRLTMG